VEVQHFSQEDAGKMDTDLSHNPQLTNSSSIPMIAYENISGKIAVGTIEP
jgi:hypothetical protein